MEEWKPIRETDQYEVSNEGRVRNVKTGRILKGAADDRGRVKVSLHIDGKQHTKKLNRLVAETFYGDECNGKDVYYRDGNHENNRLDNLVVGTRADAVRNAYENGNIKTKRNKRIRCNETGKTYDSIEECSKDVKINPTTISKCSNYPDCYNNRKGLHFEHID